MDQVSTLFETVSFTLTLHHKLREFHNNFNFMGRPGNSISRFSNTDIFERRFREKIRRFCLPREGHLSYYARKTSGHFRKSSENNENRLRPSEIFGIFQVILLGTLKIFLPIQLARSQCSENVFFLSHGRQHDLTDHRVITAYRDVHGDTLIECQPGSDQDIVSASEHPR